MLASDERPLVPLGSGQRLVAAGLLATFLALALWGAWTKSETYDEPMYILSSYSYLMTADFSLNREHPPPAKLLIGLPLLFLDLELPDDYQHRPGIVFTFFSQQPRVSGHTILFMARLSGIVLAAIMGLYVLRWGRLAFGNGAGLVAMALTLLNPNILAHCRLATNDMAYTVFSLACCFHVWRWLTTERRASLGWGALALGLAIGSKFTAFALLPVVGTVVLVESIRRRRPALLGWATLALFAAAGVLWLSYLGEARSLDAVRGHVRFTARGGGPAIFTFQVLEDTLRAVFGESTPVPLLSLLKGLDYQFMHVDLGHLTYYWGEVAKTGSWHFYLVTTLLKNPVAWVLLLVLACVVWRRTWRGFTHEWCLLAFVALQYLVFSSANVQLGFKYVLPVLPCLALMACRVFAEDKSGGERRPPDRIQVWTAAVLVVLVTLSCHLVFDDEPGEHGLGHWFPLGLASAVVLLLLRPSLLRLSAAILLSRPVALGRDGFVAAGSLLVVVATAEAMARQPDNLMYFNEWAGGPDLGSYYSVMGDDWGQDTSALGRWMQAHGVEQIFYDYYGTADPEAWGVRYRASFTASGSDPEAGLYAVHLALLRRNPDAYPYLLSQEPIAKLGGSIYVYDVSDEDLRDVRAQLKAARR
jgi:4-amino-4-deoxy-L-arabinose transferase-like glycosyltransferase